MNDAIPKIIAAKWVAPMDRPILRDAAVLIESGRIIALDSFATIRQSHPRAEVIDLPKSILLPGLVNAHVHLELSNCDCSAAPPGSFADWILGLRQRTRIDPANERESVTRAVSEGIAQCLKFGVTCVGDITNFIEISRAALRESPMRGVSYGEALGLGRLHSRFEASLSRATEIDALSPPFSPRACSRSPAQDPASKLAGYTNSKRDPNRIQIGLSPHAPYTVDLPGYQHALKLATDLGLPLATHLSENPEEEQFLRDHTGLFREIWDKLGLWQDDVATFPGSPIAFAKSIGLLDYPTLLAHVNYCTDAELDMLATGNASVVYCPRTHAYFGHPPHRWREMLSRGINVAVGTDSCASSPDLNLVDDLRLVRTLAPDLPADQIWPLATTRAAKALGLQSQLGSLTPGKAGDVIAFQVDSENPLEQILRERGLSPNRSACDMNRTGL